MCSCLTDSKYIFPFLTVHPFAPFHHIVVPAEGRHEVSHISSGLIMTDARQSRRDVCR